MSMTQATMDRLEVHKNELYEDQQDLKSFVRSMQKSKEWSVDFALQWLNHSPESRRQFILMALAHCADSDSSRMYCPDVTLEHLEEDDGQRFLDLLYTLAPPPPWQEETRPKETKSKVPIFIALPTKFSAFKMPSNSGATTAHYAIAIMRGAFLHRFIRETLGELLLAGPRADHHFTDAQQQKVPPIPRSHPSDESSGSSETALLCGRPLCRIFGERERCAFACSRCSQVGRKQMYCSRHVQVVDVVSRASITLFSLCTRAESVRSSTGNATNPSAGRTSLAHTSSKKPHTALSRGTRSLSRRPLLDTYEPGRW